MRSKIIVHIQLIFALIPKDLFFHVSTACSSVHDTRRSRCHLHIASSRTWSSREIQRSREVILATLNCKWAALFFFFLFSFCSLIVCFKTFSRLYCTVDEPDLAINMYKKHRQVSLWRLLSVLRPRISHPVTSQRCIWDFCLFSTTLFGR